MNRTTIVVGAAIILCGTSLFWLQGRFDKSDHDKAARLVQNLRRASAPADSAATETFGTYLQRRHGNRTGTWSTEITGGCRGVVRVTWRLPGDPATYAWDVEIPSQTVHPTPTSPAGRRLLEDFIAGREEKPLDLPPM